MYPSVLIFFGLLVVFATSAFNSVEKLPVQIAVHFDTNNAPDFLTDRRTYIIAFLLLLVLLPSLLVWLMAGLPRLTKGKGQVPGHEYWFAFDRRKQTETFLLRHAAWLGSMTATVIYGINGLIMQANSVSPPRLASDRFLFVLLMYLCGLCWWVTAFVRHFQRTDVR